MGLTTNKKTAAGSSAVRPPRRKLEIAEALPDSLGTVPKEQAHTRHASLRRDLSELRCEDVSLRKKL